MSVHDQELDSFQHENYTFFSVCVRYRVGWLVGYMDTELVRVRSWVYQVNYDAGGIRE